MNFSLIFPTRERPVLLNNLFKSLIETTSNKTQVEILIAVDDDDQTDVEGIVEQYKDLNIKLFNVKRSTNFSKDYYNFLARKSTGKFLWALNDDVEFITKFWDVILNAELELFFKDKKDRIVYCSTGDGINHWKFCCFPLISKEVFEETQYIFNERYTTWHADQDLSALFKYPVLCERRLNLTKKVKLIHNSYHTGMRPQDKHTHYIRSSMRVTDDIDYTDRSIRNLTARINKYKENEMVFRRQEPKVEPVKEKKEIVVETEPKEIKTNYKGPDDAIRTSPKIG